MVIYGEDGADGMDCDTCYGHGKVSLLFWIKYTCANWRWMFQPEFDPFAEEK
jgi:hypothetical protein